MTNTGSSGKGIRIKKEAEEDVALALAGQQGLHKRKKKDIFKVKCFTMGSWDIMPLSAPGRKEREKLPTQRLLQQRQRRMSRLMTIVP